MSNKKHLLRSSVVRIMAEWERNPTNHKGRLVKNFHSEIRIWSTPTMTYQDDHQCFRSNVVSLVKYQHIIPVFREHLEIQMPTSQLRSRDQKKFRQALLRDHPKDRILQFFVGGVLPKTTSNFGWKLLFVSLGTPELYDAREEPASAATSPSQVTTVGCLVCERGLGCFKHCHEAMSLKRCSLVDWLMVVERLRWWFVLMSDTPGGINRITSSSSDDITPGEAQPAPNPKVLLVIGDHMG